MDRQRRLTTALAAAAALCLAASICRADGLRSKIDGILANGDLDGAVMSLRVVELPRGRVLYSYNSEEPLSVASNAKIVTTAAALDLLGPDFELSTTLVATGDIKNGVLYGDLVIVGKGDPSISEHWNGGDVMAPLRKFAREVKACGVRTVNGDLIADDFYFDREFWCASWPDNQWIHWYEAPVGALAFNDNCVDVTVGPGPSPGAPAVITLYPDVGYISFTNKIRTTASLQTHRSRGYGFYRNKLENAVTARGWYYLKAEPVKSNFTIYDPSLYLATALKKALSDEGVSVNGDIRRMRAAEAGAVEGGRVIAVNRVSVAEVVKHCNLNSQNLYSEMLLKTLGREIEGEGSFSGGARAIARFLEEVGIRPGEYTVADGSGLSRETRFSAMALTRILQHMYTHPAVKSFRDSLPLSGYTGSLAGRLAESHYAGRVRAKTGYILRVSSLSGYALAANGKTLAFSMVFNDFKGSNRYTVKPVQDEICRLLVDSSP